MFGFGKKRTKLGKWLDRHSFSQEDLVHSSKVSRNTVSKACSDTDYTPSTGVIKKILKAIRKVDPGVKANDFWDM
jgi:transcriptional regulator with XRE-family HTH domain